MNDPTLIEAPLAAWAAGLRAWLRDNPAERHWLLGMAGLPSSCRWARRASTMP